MIEVMGEYMLCIIIRVIDNDANWRMIVDLLDGGHCVYQVLIAGHFMIADTGGGHLVEES